ncbi:TetR/AcrR family transcriptional regulator [Lentzea sp. NBRC 102530]|uniref:TetR/AcrR family transcriptional regulator n=1 Tax=Lentzea sp. NBRC 102530 TaxID=3032201 RepID=UPI0024A47753|nr:TetR/AcrR family transcriptional regulator [Lentzea sp. NBRC 102530]GLY47702.1 TetR family transcriptional regulator [Lentzea sp. NBRC 102530]
MKTLRADALRSRERIVRAAEAAFRRHGVDASLEAIAKDAGVGSATLHRHFRSRRELVEAVFQDSTGAVAAEASRLAAEHPPGPALFHWLQAVLDHTLANRGLATTLVPAADEHHGGFCGHDALEAAVAPLLVAAKGAGQVRADVTVGEVLSLVNAISLLADHDPGADPERLLGLAITGFGPRQCEQH